MTCQELLPRLDHVKPIAGGWQARCAAHDDRNPSLSVSEREGKILLRCHAGCETSAILAALGLQMSDLFADSETNGNGVSGRIVATYPYTDEHCNLLFQVVRFEPKDFRQRRPDGNDGWTWNLNGVRRVLYNLPTVLKAQSVLILEGERDVETARKFGIPGTCNPHGAGKWRSEYSPFLRGKRVAVICDADPPGVAHGREVARSLLGVAAAVKLIEALPQSKDLTEWVERGGTRDALLTLIREAPELTAADLTKWQPAKAEPLSPWDGAEGLDKFLEIEEDGADFLDGEKRILARAAVTEIFSPRGLGKSLYTLWLAVSLARRGLRVLLIDRDNPRHVVRSRLKSFGAKPTMPGMKVISREKCPPLTKAGAWALFPYADYDVVILDSFDSAAEGVGEQDSGKPSRAIAPLLDIARRENGPAVLVLGNTVKTAQHSRGSGVVEDRADVVYEVRDATGFHFTGSKSSWFEELPVVGAEGWAGRASRRKQREKFRLAFVASKFRIGVEPEPFILEIDTTTNPWVVYEVTDEVDSEGAEARQKRAQEKAQTVQDAVNLLTAEIQRREQADERNILKKEAEELLARRGCTQRIAREVVKSEKFQIVEIEGKGHPKAVRMALIKDESNRNTVIAEGAEIEAKNNSDFGCPQSMPTTEIDPSGTGVNKGSEKGSISVAHPLFPPPVNPEEASETGPDAIQV